jgi:hypothetical protein
MKSSLEELNEIVWDLVSSNILDLLKRKEKYESSVILKQFKVPSEKKEIEFDLKSSFKFGSDNIFVFGK